jgi:hypothetical protein
MGLQRTDQTEAVLQPGNAQIHDDDFGVSFFEKGDSAGARLGNVNTVTGSLEDEAVQLQNMQVVVNQKETTHNVDTSRGDPNPLWLS